MTLLETPLLHFVIIELNLEMNKQTTDTNAWFTEIIHGMIWIHQFSVLVILRLCENSSRT